MNIDVMKLLVAKTIATNQGASEERSFQLGLIAGMMPGFQGVLLSALVAQNEAPATPAGTAPTDPKALQHQLEAQKKAIEAALGQLAAGATSTGKPA